MKTVLVDNSLSVLPMEEHVHPKYIYKYIEALAEAGIKYVELDFRTILRTEELPDCMKYIFRLSNPSFSPLSRSFDFDYVSVSVNDLKEPFKVNSPVILEMPALDKISRPVFSMAQGRLDGRVAMVRFRGSYEMKTEQEAEAFINRAKCAVPVPIDVCPMNKYKTALDCAIQFSRARVDSLTMSFGAPKNFASIEEFAFAMLSVYNNPIKEMDIAALCKAEVYHQIIFGRHSGDGISKIMKLLDYDIVHLRNADTGERVRMPISLKDKMLLQKNYVTALQNFMDNEDIPDDFAYDISEAIRMFDVSSYNPDLINKRSKGILQ